MPDEAEPPRKNYGFKEREFKRDNRPASASRPPLPTVQDLAKLAGQPVPSAQPSGTPKAGDPNDVHAILQQNRAAEKQSGGDVIGIKKVSSRRKRDYWLVLLVSELGFGGVVAAGFFLKNPFFIVGGISGMVILGLAITWIMWQLMDRY